MRHPEFAWLVKGGIYIGIPLAHTTKADPLPDRAVYCSALHLEGVEEAVEAK